MIAVDSSTFVAFLKNDRGADTEAFAQCLNHDRVALPPVVVAEVLSAKPDDPEVQVMLTQLWQLPLYDGYWERAGRLRHAVLSKGRKARLGDALIAQSCIDHDVALITRDADFRHYAAHGLTLA